MSKLEGDKLWRLRVRKPRFSYELSFEIDGEDYWAIVDVVVSGNKIVVLRIGKRVVEKI